MKVIRIGWSCALLCEDNVVVPVIEALLHCRLAQISGEEVVEEPLNFEVVSNYKLKEPTDA